MQGSRGVIRLGICLKQTVVNYLCQFLSKVKSRIGEGATLFFFFIRLLPIALRLWNSLSGIRLYLGRCTWDRTARNLLEPLQCLCTIKGVVKQVLGTWAPCCYILNSWFLMPLSLCFVCWSWLRKPVSGKAAESENKRARNSLNTRLTISSSIVEYPRTA